MTRNLLLILLLALSLNVIAQRSGLSNTTESNTVLVLKKNSRIIQRYFRGAVFSFRTDNGTWFQGTIDDLRSDSIFLTQLILHYTLGGIDTTHISGFRFSIDDIRAIPTRRQIVNNIDGRISVIAGQEKFMWLRNGFILKAGAIGYTALNLTNSLIDGDDPVSSHNIPRLATAAGIFLLGVFLKSKYGPSLIIGKKYQLNAQ